MVVQAEIHSTCSEGHVTFYNIKVCDANSYTWKVRRRYKEFHKLDQELVSSRSLLEREALPSKGFLGLHRFFQNGDFSARRQSGLDSYLKGLARQVTSVAHDPMLEAFLRPAGATPSMSEMSPSMLQAAEDDEEVERPQEASGGQAEALQVAAGTSPGAEVCACGACFMPDAVFCGECGKKRGEAADGVPAPARAERTAPTVVVPICESPGTLSGKDWEDFKRSNPDLAASVECCSQLLVSPQRFENENEDTFNQLRNLLRKSDRASLEKVVGKAHVWNYLLLVASKRAFYKKQVGEVAQVLDASESWVEALKHHDGLHRAKASLFC